jgi:hypothetical protein
MRDEIGSGWVGPRVDVKRFTRNLGRGIGLKSERKMEIA